MTECYAADCPHEATHWVVRYLAAGHAPNPDARAYCEVHRQPEARGHADVVRAPVLRTEIIEILL